MKNTELEQILPSDYQAEQGVLGAILLDENAFDKIAGLLTDESFYWESHQNIFRAIQKLGSEYKPTDLVTVSQKLSANGNLEGVGGDYYLSGLVESVPYPKNITHYANIVNEKYLLRKLIIAGRSLVDKAYLPDATACSVADDFTETGLSVSTRTVELSITTDKVFERTMRGVDLLLNEKSGGIFTGWAEVDKTMGLWKPGNIILCGADSSMGKSAWALDLSRRLAMRGVCIGFFSLEMSAEESGERLLSAMANQFFNIDLPYMSIGSGGSRLRKHEAKLDDVVADSNERIKNRLHILDASGITVAGIRAECIRLMKTAINSKWLFVIDYIQLVDTQQNSKETRENAVTRVSHQLKVLASKLNVPILLLSQFNKAKEFRDHDKPTMDSFRESSALAHDANKVIALWAKKKTDPTRELIVLKNRGGLIGSVELTYSAPYCRFETAESISDARNEPVYPEPYQPDPICNRTISSIMDGHMPDKEDEFPF